MLHPIFAKKMSAKRNKGGSSRPIDWMLGCLSLDLHVFGKHSSNHRRFHVSWSATRPSFSMLLLKHTHTLVSLWSLNSRAWCPVAMVKCGCTHTIHESRPFWNTSDPTTTLLPCAAWYANITSQNHMHGLNQDYHHHHNNTYVNSLLHQGFPLSLWFSLRTVVYFADDDVLGVVYTINMICPFIPVPFCFYNYRPYALDLAPIPRAWAIYALEMFISSLPSPY